MSDELPTKWIATARPEVPELLAVQVLARVQQQLPFRAKQPSRWVWVGAAVVSAAAAAVVFVLLWPRDAVHQALVASSPAVQSPNPLVTTSVPALSGGTAGNPLPTNPISASGSSSSGASKPLRVPVIATFVALVDDNANKAEPEVCLSVGALSPAATALVNYNDRKAKEGDVGADVTRLHAVAALAVQGVNALRQACRAKTSTASATGMLRDTAAALRSIDADANVWVK